MVLVVSQIRTLACVVVTSCEFLCPWVTSLVVEMHSMMMSQHVTIVLGWNRRTCYMEMIFQWCFSVAWKCSSGFCIDCKLPRFVHIVRDLGYWLKKDVAIRKLHPPPPIHFNKYKFYIYLCFLTLRNINFRSLRKRANCIVEPDLDCWERKLYVLSASSFKGKLFLFMVFYWLFVPSKGKKKHHEPHSVEEISLRNMGWNLSLYSAKSTQSFQNILQYNMLCTAGAIAVYTI